MFSGKVSHLNCTRELFANHQIRCTRQRVALFEALRECSSHPTAEELYRMLQPAGGMSRATVYNTLEALCRAGLVRRMATTDGACRFDADISDHLHVRVRGSASHEIRDVPQDLSERLVAGIPRETLAEIERALGVRIAGVNIELLAEDGH